MTRQERDVKGRFTSKNPKNILMRITEEERQIIERFRQIKQKAVSDNFQRDILDLIGKRIQHLEL